MASLEVSTPSPPSRVHTPSTPKFGYADSWEPFSPRKSARISAQRSSQRTPSPRPTRRIRASTKSTSVDSFNPPTTPQKNRKPTMDSVRRAPSTLVGQGTAANVAESIGTASSQQSSSATLVASSRSGTTLPTPAKTPLKTPDETSKAKVLSMARSLFSSDDDAMPITKKRKAKKYTGITLESFTAENDEAPIEIFTDTRDRIPEIGNPADNPFYGESSEPSKKRGKGKLVSIPGEGQQSMEEALKRTDGAVYVFRGKRFFRKFTREEVASEPDAEDEEEELDNNLASARRIRPLTRSSIKPRLLFPSAQKVQKVSTVEDEEAVTDIEDQATNDVQEDQAEIESARTAPPATEAPVVGVAASATTAVSMAPTTPTRATSKKPGTPAAPQFALASPPSTVRATRASDRVRASETPIKSRSPFDGWRKTKSRAAPRGQKREGDSLTRGSESKRQRA